MTRENGRKPDQLREISFEVDYLENPHGSVVITAGRTKVLCTAMVEEDIPRWLRGSGTRAGCPARLGHWPASTARSPAGRSSSFSKAGLISDDDTAGTAFREDHGT